MVSRFGRIDREGLDVDDDLFSRRRTDIGYLDACCDLLRLTECRELNLLHLIDPPSAQPDFKEARSACRLR